MPDLKKDIQNFLEKENFYQKFPYWNRETVEKLLSSPSPGKNREKSPEKSAESSENPAQYDHLILFTDGAARGNPGPAGIGIVLQTPDGKTIKTHCKFLGIATNNSAEYNGLITGLTLAAKLKPKTLTVKMDSELVVKQIRGQYKVKSESLKKLFQQACLELKQFPEWTIQHVRREGNQEADRLANLAIDNR